MQHSSPLTTRTACFLCRALVACALLLALPVAGLRAQTATYTWAGRPQTYTVPAGVTAVRVVATGSNGGNFEYSSNYLRAQVQATLTVVPGEVLTVNVGGKGRYGSLSLGGGEAGYNGGSSGFKAGGGGGATDLRRASAAGSTGDYLTTRNALLVAGGGGGDASDNGMNAAATGGVPNGADGLGNGTPGLGATQTAPGGGGVPGSGSTGGAGRNSTNGGPSGGGGGGYYGGGGGVASTMSQRAGGGGGSSWVTPIGSTGISYSLDQSAALGHGEDGSLSITPIVTASYGYTGSPQTYLVPPGVTAVRLTASGASGGVYGTNTNYGLGARVQATVLVTPGEVLTVLVGGQGRSGTSGTVAGGYNGGGPGTSSGAGGGASDVRRAGAAGSTDDYLTSRNALLVAGGGGGSDSPPATGGSGGTPDGGNGAPSGSAYAKAVGGGASQTAPGSGGSFGGQVGSPGSNGAGGAGNASTYGSGGGGGYYGGGGGVPLGSGGGGSSWASSEAAVVSYSVAASGNGSVSISPLTTDSYSYTGEPQTYTVPAGVRALLVTATGASGGGASSSYGLGARAQATVLVTPGEVLTVLVGGQGRNGSSGPAAGGGYNGGGNASTRGAGGGASDVRRASAVGSTGDYLASRNALLVGGGGGGGQYAPGIGGNGGIPNGGDGGVNLYASDAGFGATQSGPGSGGRPGSNNTGGAANGSTGCGGGGGYYGGGGSRNSNGAGGGSSWVMPTGSMDISYSLAPAVGSGQVFITPVSLPDVVVSTTGQTIAAGLYNSLTVQSGGVGTLAGPVGVGVSTTVQSGGTLHDGCATLSGPGSFTLAAGGTLGICAVQGISGSGSTGSIQVTGTRSFSTDALYTYNGTAAQVTGSGLPATVRTLALSNPAGLTLTGPVTVSTAVTLSSGALSTGANLLTLGSAATLSEDADGYLLGTVQTTRALATAGVTEIFGNLGLTLTPSGATLPGSTLVRRTTGTARPGAGTSQSVRRVFDIQPTVKTGLNVALALSVRDDERNGIAAANLRLFKSEDAGATWQPQPAATVSTTAASGSQPATYTARLGGVRSFSLWTLGDASNPLPVELTAFTATATANGQRVVRLAWATASEKNSQAFEVERSADGRAFARIGTVAAAGSSSARTYEWMDTQLPGGAALLYYRLKQVDLDGTFSYSPVRPVSLTHLLNYALTIFPNPTHGGAATLTGAQPGAVVTVTDALGRPVTSATADAAGTATLRLPAFCPAGVYVVQAGARAVRLAVE